ncbi:MAG: hypothetical protein CMG74_05410 [Candidatus Marinimicrobia bacterium]|nr:hypothetical protein [Candidatus Neomarinimicrobiota bacterium]|tara:strand:+ start:8493 stop:8810 length:318 start_codon:yes stop_codon:yes gene_type:complete
MDMMKIEEVVGDVILIVLNNHEPLEKIGIDQDKIFVQVKGYDENGMWIHHPNFQVPNIAGKGRAKTNRAEASILIPWAFIVSIVHFPGAEGFDLPSPFDIDIGFK